MSFGLNMPDRKFARHIIEKSLQELPALPAVVMRVLKETESPTVTSAQIEKLICSDQALAAKVLRVVNSAYYGLTGQVNTVSQAIVILGMQQVRNLVLSVSCISAIKAKTARENEILAALWLHSFGSAAAAQILGRHKHIEGRDLEVLFIGGLLHDIGRLFLFSNFARTYEKALQTAAERQIPLDQAEQEILGISHCEIGEIMAQKWNLPNALAEILAGHEGPFNESTAPALYLVHLADWLMYTLEEEGHDFAKRPDPRAMAWYGLEEEEFGAVREEIREKVANAAQIFGLLAAA